MTLLRSVLPILLATASMATASAQDNTGSILQEGLSGRAVIQQTAAGLSRASVTQIGEGHTATVDDGGSGNLLLLGQSGTAQTASIRLDGGGTNGDVDLEGGGNLARIESGGFVNSFVVRQTSGTVTPTGNTVTLLQEGDRNFATQTQVGTGNVMLLEQRGDDNLADMLQNGNDNLMTLEQSGPANSAFLEQFGTAAAPISVTQSGGTVVTITHTGAP